MAPVVGVGLVARPALRPQAKRPVFTEVEAWRPTVPHNLPPVGVFGRVEQSLLLLVSHLTPPAASPLE